MNVYNKTKFLTILTILLTSIYIKAQDLKTVDWINDNSIEIEISNHNSEISRLNTIMPIRFKNAKIFGFGEATHHGKEFFNIKAQFFKYLVEKQNVKTFIIEDSYTCEAGINEWINGGRGDIKTIAKNFSIAPWHCKEVVELLEWIRNYNLDKDDEDKILFFGMDIQDVKNTNTEIRNLIKELNLPIDEKLLTIVDDCANKKIDYYKKTDWADTQIPKLTELENQLKTLQENLNLKSNPKFITTIRALNYLIKYTFYIQNHYSQDRDLKMFENVKWIIENKSKNGKAFIWAHNEHINHKGFGNYSKRKIYNLGRNLKEHYKNDYYSVGFDFGSGILPGVVVENGTLKGWKNHQLEKPFNKTYAETFFNTKHDIFFLDLENALKSEIAYFFSKKNYQLQTGGPGYDPNNVKLESKIYSEMYDGLIFIKKITVPDYDLNSD